MRQRSSSLGWQSSQVLQAGHARSQSLEQRYHEIEMNELKQQLEELTKELGHMKPVEAARDTISAVPDRQVNVNTMAPREGGCLMNEQRRSRQAVLCYNCNESAHFSQDCTKSRRPSKSQNSRRAEIASKMPTIWWGRQNAAPLKFEPKPSDPLSTYD